jgi:hypothetical protein
MCQVYFNHFGGNLLDWDAGEAIRRCSAFRDFSLTTMVPSIRL